MDVLIITCLVILSLVAFVLGFGVGSYHEWCKIQQDKKIVSFEEALKRYWDF